MKKTGFNNPVFPFYSFPFYIYPFYSINIKYQLLCSRYWFSTKNQRIVYYALYAFFEYFYMVCFVVKKLLYNRQLMTLNKLQQQLIPLVTFLFFTLITWDIKWIICQICSFMNTFTPFFLQVINYYNYF